MANRLTLTLMKRLGLFYHPHKERALELTDQWREQIMARGAPAPLIASAWDEKDASRACEQVDLVLTLGGDGTLLRAVRYAAPFGVAAIGVKLGHVGFLSGLDPDEFQLYLERLLQGEYWIEERSMVQAHLQRAGRRIGTYEGINDVVVSRGKLARVIRVEVAIDGEPLDEFAVDGVIVSTATGSTAYSLAAGGPILAPTVREMLLTLISPYLSPIHSLVVPEGAQVALQVNSPIPAILTIDGQQDVELEIGDVVETETGPHIARFARLDRQTYFYRTLLDRLREKGD